MVTAGAAGVAVYEGSEVQTMAAYPATPRDVTGAGDALVAGVLFGLTEGLGCWRQRVWGWRRRRSRWRVKAPRRRSCRGRRCMRALRISEEVREALAARPSGGGAGDDHRDARDAVSGEPRDGAVGGGGGSRGGAIPATIAVIGGAVRVGLSGRGAGGLAAAKDVLKLSRNDLAYAIATGRPGATTVAATMICARLRGNTGVRDRRDRRRPPGRGNGRSTSRRTWRSWRGRRWRWCAPGRRRCWTFRRRSSIWRPRRPGDRVRDERVPGVLEPVERPCRSAYGSTWWRSRACWRWKWSLGLGGRGAGGEPGPGRGRDSEGGDVGYIERPWARRRGGESAGRR